MRLITEKNWQYSKEYYTICAATEGIWKKQENRFLCVDKELMVYPAMKGIV